jgi:NADPH:quinone reductase-like Zn-dependent oxidoreductase
VGLAAIQVARFLGARAAGTSRSSGKLPAIVRAGADLAIDTTERSFAEAVEERWGRDAVDVVLDPVGAATLAGDVRVLRTGGRVIILSMLSGARAELDIAAFWAKRGRLIGSALRARPREEKAQLVARFREEILPGFAAGKLSVDVDSVFPAARSAEAFERMKANRNVGKILIDWNLTSA